MIQRLREAFSRGWWESTGKKRWRVVSANDRFVVSMFEMEQQHTWSLRLRWVAGFTGQPRVTHRVERADGTVTHHNKRWEYWMVPPMGYQPADNSPSVDRDGSVIRFTKSGRLVGRRVPIIGPSGWP